MIFSHTVWAGGVAAGAGLPDQRLERRMAAILVDTVENPSASIPEATHGDAGQVKATYRFDSNPRVTASALQLGFTTDTARRCLDQAIVLVVQDTTSLNFTGLTSIPELGPIDSGSQARGVHVHTALAVTASGRGR